MNPIKSFLALTAILCVSTLYAEDNNTYIKQQVAYKDQGASGKELTWDFGMLSPIAIVILHVIYIFSCNLTMPCIGVSI